MRIQSTVGARFIAPAVAVVHSYDVYSRHGGRPEGGPYDGDAQMKFDRLYSSENYSHITQK